MQICRCKHDRCIILKTTATTAVIGAMTSHNDQMGGEQAFEDHMRDTAEAYNARDCESGLGARHA